MKKSVWIMMMGYIAFAFISCASNKQENTYQVLRNETIRFEQSIIALMQKANTPYEDNIEEIDTMFSDISDIYQLTASLEDTEFIIQQWDILLSDAERTLLIVKYFEQWQHEKTLNGKTIAIGVGNITLVMKNIIMATKRLAEQTN